MDTGEDDLRMRRGKFLSVEKEGDLYRETRANGEIMEYALADFPFAEYPLEIGVEAMALHATLNVASGAVRHMLTGSTREQFRAIGAEGSYKIFDVSVTSATPAGVILIRKTYASDGHLLRSKMLVGVREDTILQFEDNLTGIFRLGGIEGRTFRNSETGGRTITLDHWREHVISNHGFEDLVAEWQLTFSTATLSPEGCWLPGLFHRSTTENDRRVTGDIGIRYSGEHPLSKTIETLAENFEALTANVKQSSKNIFYALFAIAAVLTYLALTRS